MVEHKLFRILRHLRRRGSCYLLAKLVHQLVLVGSGHLELLEVRGIGRELHRLARFGKDRLLRKVGKHHDERCRPLTHRLVGQAASVYPDGINTIDTSVEAINIKLTLVHVEDSAFDLESVSGSTTSHKNQGE